MTDQNQTSPAEAFDADVIALKKRKKAFFYFGTIVTSIVVLYSTYYILYASHHVTTDNAYVAGEMAQVTPAVGGIVDKIHFTDTSIVKAGDTLITLDQQDFVLALKRAKANLDGTAAELEKAQIDAKRREQLAKSGSVSGEEVTNTSHALKVAQAKFDMASSQKEQAELDLERTIIKAPIAGIIAKRQVQLGQRVQVGSPLLSIVPLNDLHVDANFKESQVASLRIGQPVQMTSDLYGNAVIYHGKIVGMAGGTGSAFSIIPAQNATGNWIKVVQRLPIRISLDQKELESFPLKIGLSMLVDVDISASQTEQNATK